jgi:hypothetical protein
MKITPKLKTKEDIKNSLIAHYAKLGLTKTLIHGPSRASHNYFSVANIEKI